MMKRVIVIILLAFAAAAVTQVSHGLGRKDKVENITIAVSAQPLTAPVYVAKEKGFFEKEGLHVTFRPYTAGVDAMNAMLSGRAQFCTVADTPLVFAGLKGEKLYIVATIGNSKDYVKIVARRDRGIEGPQDLKRKSIGVRMGTSSEYFLYAFLTFNGIPKESVRMVDVGLENMEDALASGKIDAAVAWDPYLTMLQKTLRSNSVVLSNKYIYKLDWNIAGSRDFIRKNHLTVVKMLRAVENATDYIAKHPGDAERITARNLGRKAITLTGNTFDVYLGQSLLINLESQARWAIESGLTDKKEVPDFLSMIYPDAIEAVRPEAVTVIHQ